MPLCPYTCDDCGAEFEALVLRPSAAPADGCPGCRSEKLTRGLALPARAAASAVAPATNCRGDAPPCGASWCGRPRT